MSFISWNCRGLGNPATVQILVDIIHTKKPVLLFLMETRLGFIRMEDIKRRLGFDYLFTVDSVGLNGGLALIWKKELEISILSHSVNHIDTSVRTATTSPIWRFTGFYGCLERHRRRISWALLK